MALRLTSSSPSPDAPPTQTPIAAAQAESIAVERLVALAAAALAGGRLIEYRELFKEADALEDPNRRYQARKRLLEQGLGSAGQMPASKAADVLLVTAAGALAALNADPAEPVLLNYAGIAFYELWSLEAARALFLAAQRLDPALPHLRRNLAECKRRRGSGTAPRRLVHGIPPEFVRRAREIADRARPAKGMKLSLCMIVRDEEEMLPRCLEAVASVVDEIVIVDTGSKDRTIEIAGSFGARVIEREWTGSFADARNTSFDHATGDWLLYLDADEVLVAQDAEQLRGLTSQTWRDAFYLVETNFTGHEEAGTAVTHSAMRMFRNRPEYRFSGRLHEQIAQNLPAYLPERIHQSNVRVEHYGYLGSVRDAKEKSRRNIELLLAQKAESAPTPFLHFNLGSEYFAAEDPAAALAEFEQAWAMIAAEGPDGQHEFTPSLLVRLVKALRVCDRPQDAIEMARVGLEMFPGFTDLVYEQAIASLSCEREDDAIEYFERCLALGDAPTGYTAVVGCGTYLPRISLAELHLGKGEIESALELLRTCAETDPGFFGLILPYASALLRAGESGAQVVTEIEQRIPQLTGTGRFMLGTALFEAGAAQDAEQQFRLVLEGHPHSARARAALSEALLRQRLYEQAASEAAEMDEEDPLAVVASRSELFGRIAGGDLDRAQQALERAARVGMPSAELAVFRGWLGLRTGRPSTQSLPPAAWPLLEVVLEALLRVQDFENFEAVAPLVGAGELPVREQRELLGRVYLRRGFLRSAAREWMAVVNDRPDARALLGLAQVAIANRQPEAARTFAANALALDPGCAAAAAILDAQLPEAVALAS